MSLGSHQTNRGSDRVNLGPHRKNLGSNDEGLHWYTNRPTRQCQEQVLHPAFTQRSRNLDTPTEKTFRCKGFRVRDRSPDQQTGLGGERPSNKIPSGYMDKRPAGARSMALNKKIYVWGFLFPYCSTEGRRKPHISHWEG